MSRKDRVLTVGLGVLLGVAVTLGAGRLPRHRRYDPERMLGKFNRELSLSPGQQAAVRAALDESARKLEELHQDTDAKLLEIRLATRAQIRKALDPGQQNRFDEMSARWDARHNHKEER